MSSVEKLEVSLQLIKKLLNLIDGNEYQQFLFQHLISIQFELERQLTNLQSHIKIKK